MTLRRVAECARRVGRGAAVSVAELTPGQRWTVSLMLGLAVIVLAFGLPTATRFVLPGTPAATAEPPEGPAQATGSPSPDLPGAASLVVSPVEVGPIDEAPAPGREIAPPLPTPLAADLRVVALVDPSFGVGDRTDEAMARRYLATAGVSATVVPIAEIAATCAATQGAGLVISGGGLPAELGACVRAGGAITLSFDDGGVLGAPAGGVSSRRGVARSLLDTADRAGTQLAGKLALVADERFKAALESVVPVARARGLDIATVRWLTPGAPPADVALDLARAGVAGVLFATTTKNQGVIGSQLRTLSPNARLAVLDAADSVLSGLYPPVFDGAVAVTSVQLPWHPGAAAQRAACRATWETAQTPPVILGDAELLRALTWCQHAAMAAAMIQRLDGGPLEALTGQTVASPITSALAALGNGDFGPTLVTEATWSAGCACWVSTTPFTEVERS